MLKGEFKPKWEIAEFPENALEKTNLMSITPTQDGCVLNIQNGLSQYTEEDISCLIQAVKKGNYDDAFII